jgi:hypothetical protein
MSSTVEKHTKSTSSLCIILLAFQPSICLLSCKLVNMTSLMRLANTPIYTTLVYSHTVTLTVSSSERWPRPLYSVLVVHCDFFFQFVLQYWYTSNVIKILDFL